MQQPYYLAYASTNTAHLQQGMYPVVHNQQQQPMFAQQQLNQGRRNNTDEVVMQVVVTMAVKANNRHADLPKQNIIAGAMACAIIRAHHANRLCRVISIMQLFRIVATEAPTDVSVLKLDNGGPCYVKK